MSNNKHVLDVLAYGVKNVANDDVSILKGLYFSIVVFVLSAIDETPMTG